MNFSSRSEDFFAREFYKDWLNWVQERSHDDPLANELAIWLKAESEFMLSALASHYARVVGKGQVGRLLDIGCGFGRHIVAALSAHDDWKAVGIDINATMIDAAVANAERRAVRTRVHFVVGDASELAGVASSSIDFAICMTNTLGNMPPSKQGALLNRLTDVLRPGARALFSAYSTSADRIRVASYEAIGLVVEVSGSRVVTEEGLESQSFEVGELVTMIEQAGLVVERMERLGVGLAVIAHRGDGTAKQVIGGAARGRRS
jgi:ubiquinone/menaquinone biosynthesis C-methylase UbiE